MSRNSNAVAGVFCALAITSFMVIVVVLAVVS